MNYKKLAIIGGGAAGFFCAANLPLEKINNKLRITIFEQHKEPMIKLSASGGARCNLTNNIQDINDLVKYYPRGEKFLYSVFNQFSAMDTINWFEEKNVKLYTDECGCVFPNSDNSETITNTLLKQIPKNITEIRPGARIDKVQHENGQFILFTNNRQLEFDFVLICTGGTYSIKGPIEDFKGYELAIQAGHTIVTAKPALSSMKIADKNIADLAGITINDITVVAYFNNKKIAEHSGDLLFTHTGISGPVILNLCSKTNHIKFNAESPLTIKLNLCHYIDLESFESKLLEDFKSNINKNIANYLVQYAPKNLINFILEKCNIQQDKKVNQITREERKIIAKNFVEFELPVSKISDKEAIVTAGGVNLKEIDAKTLQSKLISGLFFAGEILDVDGFCGGFNLQFAWSSGYIVAQNILKTL